MSGVVMISRTRVRESVEAWRRRPSQISSVSGAGVAEHSVWLPSLLQMTVPTAVHSPCPTEPCFIFPIRLARRDHEHDGQRAGRTPRTSR